MCLYLSLPHPLPLPLTLPPSLTLPLTLPPSLTLPTLPFLSLSLAVLRDAQAGATTSLNCAVNPKLNSQKCMYFADCRPAVSSLESR